jgi:hypothetical protein
MIKRKRKFELPIELIGLEEDNYHLLIRSCFEDNEPKFWILDTGASKTVFDVRESAYYTVSINSEMQINSAGIGTGTIETTVGVLHPIWFSDFEKRRFEVAMIDLEQVNQIYSQFTDTRIVGLLGSDFFHHHKAVIDYQKLTITLYR